MAYTLLRRKIILNNTGVGAPYSATNDFFDLTKRRPYTTQEHSQVDNPFELAEDTEILRYEYAPNKTRVVYYNGNGSVYTKNLRATLGPFSPSLKLKATPNVGITSLGRNDAYVDLTGQNGFPPYQVEVVGEQGPAKGFYQAGVSQSEIYPVRFYNLGEGLYTLRIRDATGDGRTLSIRVGVTQFGYPMGTILRDTIVRDRFIRLSWRGNELTGSVDSYRASQISGNYTIPYGTLVDGYLLPGSNGTIWRQVYAGYQKQEAGPAEVYFIDTSTVATSNLELDNLILFNPDTTREKNGGALVEVRGGTLPLRFTFTGPGVSKTNATGSIDGLGAGDYQVKVTDALGGEFATSFKLTDRYRLWKYLDYDNLDSVPLRVELWRRDFDGLATSICGTDRPVVIEYDSLRSSVGGQGDLLSVVSRSAELNFLADIDLFEPVVINDSDGRNCRCDFYYKGKLDFRGYVKPDVYTAPLLDGLQPTTLTATDGIVDLEDTQMLGHIGQRLSGHRPVLNTLLHCLSRCGISLPLHVFTNRRDATMASLDAPEQFATTNRVGYYDDEKDEPADQRTVVDGLAQLLGGTLVQREGTWQIRSALEAALPVGGRTYRPAGTPLPDAVAPAPAGAIRPPTSAVWHWLDASQTKQVRPGWKSLVGTGDAGWLKNAFWQGEVFSDTQAWLDDYSQLRGTYGWRPPTGETFPLVLQRLGDKGKDHTTLWPRSQGLSMRDGRSLVSPPLPLAAGPESVPAYLTITARFVATDFYVDDENKTVQAPTVAKQATLPYEVLVDGQSTGIQLATFDLSKDGKDSTFEAPIPALPVGGNSAELRVYSWTAPDVGQLDSAYDLRTAPQPRFDKPALVKDFINGVQRLFIARRYDVGEPLTDTYNWEEITATNASSGQLLVSSIGIQLRPQEATWDGADTFRADGPGGTVRPTEPLKSYHVDVPLDAGLYAGNLHAFGKGVGSIDDAMTTSWSRPSDLDDSPLLEANVYDGLALRANNARLLVGTVRHKGVPPPYLLDSVDAPSDVPGRRFFVGAATWDTKAAEVEVSLIEIGKGEGADFAWPDGARIVNRSYEFAAGRYVPYLRAVRGGIRVRHG